MSFKNLLQNAQNHLKTENFDGWLVYDFDKKNPAAELLLGKDRPFSRRLYIFIPKEGKPKVLASVVEKSKMNGKPVEDVSFYFKSEELFSLLDNMLSGCNNILMETSSMNILPKMDIVPYGVIEYLKSKGKNISSSENLLQFISMWDERKIELQKKSVEIVGTIKDSAFSYIRLKIDENKNVSEYDVQQYILTLIKNANLVTTADCDPPIVAIGKNAADPHYMPQEDEFSMIGENELVLIDLWAKVDKEDSPYGDITWMGYTGKDIPHEVKKRFNDLADARDEGVKFLKEKLENGVNFPCGYEIDDVVRDYLEKRGYSSLIKHRTGHDLGCEWCHGFRANIDGTETKDTRRLTPGTGFTIEPGLYEANKMGLRTEINVVIDTNKKLHITSGVQQDIVII